MSEPLVHIFSHEAMATDFQVRIADEDKKYAAQAALAAFDLLDGLETLLTRFRETSDIAQIAALAPGEELRLSEPTFNCLEIARKMESATRGAFSVAASAMKTQGSLPQCTLFAEQFTIRCDRGKLAFDLGAIGKGFALDRMGELLREWQCPAFLLVAGGSSILAGTAPAETSGWSCGLGDDNSPRRYQLAHCSLSGSGLAVKGEHIFDPRTGEPAKRKQRAWALTDTAAESDALSTACMVLDEPEITEVLATEPAWLVILDAAENPRVLGRRPSPPTA